MGCRRSPFPHERHQHQTEQALSTQTHIAIVRFTLRFTMPSVEPSIFDDIDEAAEERAWREAEAACANGRVISHEAVTKCLLSWGTHDELAPPTVGS